MNTNRNQAKNVLIALFLMLLPLMVCAQTKVEIDGIWYNLNLSREAEVTSKPNSHYKGQVTIPSKVTYDGGQYSVTRIGDKAFSSCSSLTAINIPEGVTSIGNHAFYGCSSLTSITIPEGVTSIESWLFSNCNSLTAITIPESVTRIGEYAFTDCDHLTTITIPEGVTSIGSNAFYGCRSLTSITLPKSMTRIGDSAFLGCSSLTSITLPEGMTSIEGHTFSNCRSLTAINIPEGVTRIGDCAFSYCNSLTAINIPEGVTFIGESAFYGSGLTTINIPEGVTRIERQTFTSCSSLTAINIPEGVTSIGYGAFSNCYSLTSITLPEGMTSIEGYTFSNCRSLTTITIPEGVTSIRDGAFYGCWSLTTINIPEGVTRIEKQTFLGCRSLTTITIPEGVTSIGESAFYNCSSLTSITIPKGVTFIGESAFYNCSSLTTIVLPKNIDNISTRAFANCSELLDVYCYADSVRITKENVFDGSYIEQLTLHVPASALSFYKRTEPWSRFGSIAELGAAITGIRLDKTSATLTEGEELTFTITTTPEDADINLIFWSSSNPNVAAVDNKGKVTAVAPGAATITAMANDGSGVSASCEVTVKELILGKCDTPIISYKDGKILLACDTDEVIFISETTEDVAGNRNDAEFAIIPTYTVTVYATKKHYKNSDEASLTLCWIPCKEEHKEDNGILTIPTKPMLISTQGGVITISGLADSTVVTACNTAGQQLATATAACGTATLNTILTKGNIAVVRIGNYSVKVAIK